MLVEWRAIRYTLSRLVLQSPHAAQISYWMRNERRYTKGHQSTAMTSVFAGRNVAEAIIALVLVSAGPT